MELNHFSDTNMRVSSSSSDELVAIQAKFDQNQLKLGRHLKDIVNVQEALKAFSNYMAIARHFSPTGHRSNGSARKILRGIPNCS